MQRLTREQARRNIVGLGLPQIVLDAFDEKPLPYDLDIRFRFPYQVFPMAQPAYWNGPITPIWTGADGYTIVAYDHDPARLGFFRFDLESGEVLDPIRMNWQQVLVREFKNLWELETPAETLRQLAGLFEFRYVEELIDELPQAKLDTTEKDIAWYHAFLMRMGG
jgi:hypothetical protein